MIATKGIATPIPILAPKDRPELPVAGAEDVGGMADVEDTEDTNESVIADSFAADSLAADVAEAIVDVELAEAEV